MEMDALLGRDRVAGPSYDRATVTAGIAHFGVGGFHRAHQAMYVDGLLERGLAQDWGICAIGALPQDRRIIDTLRAQDGLYTLVVKHADGRREPRVIGSIVETMFAPDGEGAVVRRLADPAIRIVSLTITEGGYEAARPSPVFDLMARALRLRHDVGVAPFAVVSCDNLPSNGAHARRALRAVASGIDEALGEWIDAEVPFPGSMVDRITPVTTPADVTALAEVFGVHDGWPVVCEEYAQWVLEDRFPCGRPPLEEVGVQLVDDVAPYELMKLRLLNGGHQVIGYLASLAGHRYVHEVCQDPAFATLLMRYLAREAIPTLPPVPGTDLSAYRHAVVQRFTNPQIADTLRRICTDGSDRIPQSLLPVVTENLRTGGEIAVAALALAGWALAHETWDDIDDRHQGRLRAAARSGSFLTDPLFGDLGSDQRLAAAFDSALVALRRDGVRVSVARLAR